MSADEAVLVDGVESGELTRGSGREQVEILVRRLASRDPRREDEPDVGDVAADEAVLDVLAEVPHDHRSSRRAVGDALKVVLQCAGDRFVTLHCAFDLQVGDPWAVLKQWMPEALDDLDGTEVAGTFLEAHGATLHSRSCYAGYPKRDSTSLLLTVYLSSFECDY